MVDQVRHCVTDLQRSARFYEGVPGFTHQRDRQVRDGLAAARGGGQEPG